MFEQRHVAGREGAFDFTDCNELGVTISGQVFEHLLFQFVLSFSFSGGLVVIHPGPRS